MKIICPQELLDLRKKDDGKYPQAVVKKFRLQYTLLENIEESIEMYKHTTLRPHKLTGALDWFLWIDLTKWPRIEIKLLKDWMLEVVRIYRISNHYE